MLETLNRALFLMINAGPDTPRALLTLAEVVADDLIFLIPVMLLALWLWGSSRHRQMALLACSSALVALFLNQLIGLVWFHPRPFMVPLGHTWINHPADSSFPSDHTTVFASIGMGLFLLKPRWYSLLTILVGILVAWSRIFLSVHFPLDMLGAAITALAGFLICLPLRGGFGVWLTTRFEFMYRTVFATIISRGWTKS